MTKKCLPIEIVADESVNTQLISRLQASSMWRIYSGGDRDTFYLPENMRGDIRTEPFEGHRFNLASQGFLDKKGDLHEIVKGMLLRHKLRKNIDIARGSPFPSYKCPK